MTSRPLLPFDDRGPQADNAPVMVFVHGFLNDASIWDNVVAELEADVRCVCLDLPGHGRSPGNGPGTYDRDSVLDDIRATLRHLGIDQAVFVGHSLGGYLSLALAIETPDLVSGLGLVGAGPGFRSPNSRERWNASVDKTVAERDIPAGMEVISKHVDSMVMDGLDRIDVPAVVVVGERDKAFMASVSVFEKNLDVVSTTVAEGAGHMVHLKAAPVVAQALRAAFLTAH